VAPPQVLLLLWRSFKDGDWIRVLAFLFEKDLPLSLFARFVFIVKMYRVSYYVRCEHAEAEILSVVRAVLTIPASVKGCVVEAGCFKGGSTAKLSIAARLAKRDFLIFDSFEGIPQNVEPHEKNIWGGIARFPSGHRL